jgi:hypothetical protein
LSSFKITQHFNLNLNVAFVHLINENWKAVPFWCLFVFACLDSWALWVVVCYEREYETLVYYRLQIIQIIKLLPAFNILFIFIIMSCLITMPDFNVVCLCILTTTILSCHFLNKTVESLLATSFSTFNSLIDTNM